MKKFFENFITFFVTSKSFRLFFFQLKSRGHKTYLEVVNFVSRVIHVEICFEALSCSKNMFFRKVILSETLENFFSIV